MDALRRKSKRIQERISKSKKKYNLKECKIVLEKMKISDMRTAKIMKVKNTERNKKFSNKGTTTTSCTFMGRNLGPSKSSEAASEGLEPKYIFRSKTGSKYKVDYFESVNIKKLYVTVNYREKSFTQECNQYEQNAKQITVSELLTSFRTHDEENYNKVASNPYMKTLFYMLSEKEKETAVLPSSSMDLDLDNELQSSNSSLDTISVTSERVDKFLSNEVKSSESNRNIASDSNNILKNKDNENFVPKSMKKDFILGGQGPFTKQDSCVQCFYIFQNEDDNYNHLCNGKREKGFLCEYCEKVLSTRKRFNKHMQMHFPA